MSAINKTLKIKFKGVEHNIKMSMSTIDAIEDEMNLVSFINRLGKGDVRLSHAAKLFSIILKQSGVKTSQEDVYTEMFSGNDDNVKGVIDACGLIVGAIFPQSDTVTSAKKKPVRAAKKS